MLYCAGSEKNGGGEVKVSGEGRGGRRTYLLLVGLSHLTIH